MLDNKQIRMLELLDSSILRCKNCELYNGGKVLPYWTSLSKYVIIGEAPGKEEVENNEPFIGKSGIILWAIMGKYGFRKEEFLIINSVQCMPIDGEKNLTKWNVLQCKQIWRKYIKVINPLRMITFGDYGTGAIDGEYRGTIRKNSRGECSREFDDMEYVTSVHPSYCIYNSKSGPLLLEQSIKKLRKMGQ